MLSKISIYLRGKQTEADGKQSNKVPVAQHPHPMHPLTPLITYSNDHFSPGSPPTHLSPEIDPKTGFPVPLLHDSYVSSCILSPADRDGNPWSQREKLH
ncbi:hypothetical protein MC885_005225 [Smutsia gigantea]|nr:hypothetical protein MC885_005225 [Smutsia gigantea]